MQITIETKVSAPLDAVWRAWTTPADIVQWNAASDAWHTPRADIDLREGGAFNYRMEAKDGSMGFDFAGKFRSVVEHERIEFVLEDERPVLVAFHAVEDGVIVRETFAAEDQNQAEMQRQGWQAILNNFAQHVEQRV